MVPAWSTSGISGATIWYQHHPRHRPKPPGGIIGPVITGNAFFPIWYHIHGFVGPRELGWSDTLYSFLESDGPVQCNAPTCETLSNEPLPGTFSARRLWRFTPKEGTKLAEEQERLMERLMEERREEQEETRNVVNEAATHTPQDNANAYTLTGG